MNNLPCEVVKDLLPSYIEKLTSKTTNRMVDEHLTDCADCRSMKESMQEEQPSAAAKEENGNATEKKEIDFLKKNRRRNRMILIGCIAAVAMILAVVFVNRYVVGEYYTDTTGDFFSWEADVQGNRVDLTGWVVDDIFKITNMEFDYSDGILYGYTKSVPSGMVASLIYGKNYHTTYTAPGQIRQVEINHRIIWNGGDPISTITSVLYLNKHPYMGNFPADIHCANLLNLSNYLGPYQNELESSEAPLTWKLQLTQDIPSDRRNFKETDMKAFAYALLAVIENLDQITYEYTVDGKAAQLPVTAKDATAFLGQEIKNCYEDASLLEELIRKAGLTHYTFGTFVDAFTVDPNPIIANIVNNTDEEIYGFETTIYVDGKAIETQGGINANESPWVKGSLMTFRIEPEALESAWDSSSLVEVSFTLLTGLNTDVLAEDGDTSDKILIPIRLRIPAYGWMLHDIHITGNLSDGFQIIQ